RGALNADIERIHAPPLAGELGIERLQALRFTAGNEGDRYVRNRRECAARAAERIDDFVAGRHGATAVGPAAEAARQKAGGGKVFEAVASQLLAAGGEAGEHEQLDIGHGLHAPLQLYAVLRAEQALEEC